MTLFPTRDQTIEGAAHAIRMGESSCVRTVEKCLAQIDAREAEIHAWVSVDRDGALNQARALDAALAAGQWLGPLHGIPIAIKDIVAVAGTPTGAGSPWHAKLPAAQWDAEIVTRLRRAGAIILGKTVTTEFASFDPPPTRNPWNTERTPGGSSSGSAAAVATGMCLGAIGSQTGGSITRPAAFCGVAGCKPTYGTVSLDGILPLAPSMDHPGPIARTVRDLATLLSVISSDAGCVGVLAQPSELPPRIGRLRGCFEDSIEASYERLVEQAVNHWKSAGAQVLDLTVPATFADVLTHHRRIMATECAAYHERAFAEHRTEYGRHIAALIEEGLAVKAVDFLTTQAHQRALRFEMLRTMEPVDVLITPATTGSAPDTSTTGDPRMNSPWSYTGFPTISFPIGLAGDGMPLSIQCIGRPHSEPQLFAAALWAEDVIQAASG